MGWGLIVVGVVGLAVPGLQGVLTLFAGSAVLSLTSEKAHRLLRRAFGRWPRGWRRVETLRRRLHGIFQRSQRDRSSGPPQAR